MKKELKEAYLVKEWEERLKLKDKITYSAGAFSDSIPFNIFYYYFLYFLTDVVGISPAVGGVISLVAVLWDAFTDPIVGHLSDNCKSKYGRRRPFMLCGSLPLYVFTILLFTAVGNGGTGQILYYMLIAICFWTAYKFYVIPFLSLSAELTLDFKERNNIKSLTGVIMYTSTWLVTAGPMFVLDKVIAAGGTEKTAWMVSAIMFGLIGLAGALICWRCTRGKERMTPEEIADKKGKTKKDIIKDYMILIKLKPFRNIAIYIFFTCVNYSVASAAFVYLMSNNLGLSEAKQAGYWTAYTLICFALLPICNFLSNKIGKKMVTILLCLVTICGCVIYAIVGIQSYEHLLVYTVIYNISNVCFWTIGYSMVNDCCEAYEFITGERREGSINGIASFAQKLGSAVGMWLSGILLSFVGYDASLAEQSEEALNGILQLNTSLPAVMISISVIFVILYPITEKRYHMLLQVMHKEKERSLVEDNTELKKIFK